jgi:AraC-like DNA-binding protein
MDPDWCALIAPLKWKGDYLINGRESKPNELVIAGGPNGFVSRAQERYGFFVPIRKKPVLDACRALSGKLFDFSEFENQHRSLSTPLGKQLRQGFAEVVKVSSRASCHGVLAKSIEKDLITQLALFLLEQTDSETHDESGIANALSVVRKAKLEIEARHPDTVSLAELCAATGVGKAWLHRCFMEILGLSPIAYLRARRLSVARQWFLDCENPPRSVKDVSIALGFTNGGRFAASYADLFGEMPVETLARTTVPSEAFANQDNTPL